MNSIVYELFMNLIVSILKFVIGDLLGVVYSWSKFENLRGGI